MVHGCHVYLIVHIRFPRKVGRFGRCAMHTHLGCVKFLPLHSGSYPRMSGRRFFLHFFFFSLFHTHPLRITTNMMPTTQRRPITFTYISHLSIKLSYSYHRPHSLPTFTNRSTVGSIALRRTKSHGPSSSCPVADPWFPSPPWSCVEQTTRGPPMRRAPDETRRPRMRDER